MFPDTIAAINELKELGLIEDYAVAGAMALVFWTEAVPTFDLDVLVLLPPTDGLLVSLGPIYEWAQECGYEKKDEHLEIHGVPVQFLPAYNALAEEAVREAKTLNYNGLPARVVGPEYLIALALDPPAKTSRRKERAASLRESASISEKLLADLMARYNLSWE